MTKITKIHSITDFKNLRVNDYFIRPTIEQMEKLMYKVILSDDTFNDNTIFRKVRNDKGTGFSIQVVKNTDQPNFVSTVKSGIYGKDTLGSTCSDTDVLIRVDVDDNYINCSSACMDFSDALRALKAGKVISKMEWIKLKKVVVLQKGYPDGINCNKQTTDAWGMNEGDLFKCNPYLQIQNEDGSHSMWTPTVDDILSDSWVIVEFDK